MGLNSPKNPVNAVWANQVISDSALFQAILFHAGVHYDAVHRAEWSSKTVYHKGEAIRLLQEHLASEKEALSDATIGTVALLGAQGVSLLSE